MRPSMFVKVVGASLLIRFVAREQLDGTDHDRMGPGHDGAFRSPAERPGADTGPRGLGLWCGRPRGPVASSRCAGRGCLCGSARALFAGAFVVARRHAAPGCEAGGGAQAGHVDPPLRHQQLPTPLIDAGHGGQDRDRPRKGHGGGRRRCGRGGTQVGEYAGDLGPQRVERCLQEVDVGQLHGQPLPMMVPYQPGQRLLQYGDLAPQTPLGPRGHRRRIGPPVDQCRQHRPPRHAHDEPTRPTPT